MNLKRAAAYGVLHLTVTAVLWGLCLSLALGYGFDNSTNPAEYIAVYAAYILTALLSPLPWLIGLVDFSVLTYASDWVIAALFIANSFIYAILLDLLHERLRSRKAS